jgi:hypothetical protein
MIKMIKWIKNKGFQKRYGRFYLKNLLIYNLNKKFIKLYLKNLSFKIEALKERYKVKQIWI